MKKVFITGLSGFVGSHLADLLANRYEISGTVYGSEQQQINHVKPDNLYRLDLLDREATIKTITRVKPDWVMHLAALSSPAKSYDDPRATVTNNIESTINLLDAVRRLDSIEKILIVGSAEEYGKVKEEDNPIDEQVPFAPMSPYAVSKVAQDLLGLQYFFSYDLPIVRVRPFNHTGPRRPPTFALPAFAQQIAQIEAGKQEPVVRVGNLSAIRDFSDVRDMVKAYELAMLSANMGEVYNIGSGIGVRISDLLDMLIDISGVTIEIQEDPTKLRPVEVAQLVADASKFKQQTGWSPSIPLEETIQGVLDYWRQKVKSEDN